MPCYRSRDNWHSFVKNSLDEAEMNEMKAHLCLCPECQKTVLMIQETISSFSLDRSLLKPPAELKINIMRAIDQSKYQVPPKKLSEGFLPHHHNFKNWGLSMVAAGIFLFAFNLTPFFLFPGFSVIQISKLNAEVGKQIELPFTKMGLMAHNAFSKLESLTSLTLSMPKFTPKTKGEHQ